MVVSDKSTGTPQTSLRVSGLIWHSLNHGSIRKTLKVILSNTSLMVLLANPTYIELYYIEGLAYHQIWMSISEAPQIWFGCVDLYRPGKSPHRIWWPSP